MKHKKTLKNKKTKSSFNYTFMQTLNKNKTTLLQMINGSHEIIVKALWFNEWLQGEFSFATAMKENCLIELSNSFVWFFLF